MLSVAWCGLETKYKLLDECPYVKIIKAWITTCVIKWYRLRIINLKPLKLNKIA